MSEFEFEIKPGERLPPETLMPLPEMSYEQELLNTPVPFENRVAFLSASIVPEEEMSSSELINVFPGRQALIEDIIATINPPIESNGKGDVYAAYTKELVEEELAWHDQLQTLDERISAYVAARLLFKGYDWIHQNSYALGVYPEVKYFGKRMHVLYPKAIVPMLRTLILHTPPTGDWYSPREAVDYVHKDIEWITKTVARYGLRSAMRVSGNNILAEHYPLETILRLEEFKRQLPPPAGDWLTVKRLAALLHRDKEYVARRIGPFKHMSERRLTDGSRERTHYPPEVFKLLAQAMAEEEEVKASVEESNVGDREPTPSASGWLSTGEIARMLGKTRYWVDIRLKRMNEYSESRLDTMNRPALHYHFDAVDRLQLNFLVEEENKDASELRG